jgi:GDPmannose 4,6-dehydratase
MWLMLQQPEPDDYVLATGESHSVREFVELAFANVDRNIVWRGDGIEEQGLDKDTGAVLVAIDERHFRPTEVETLLGNAGKARRKLGWRHRTNFRDLVAEMVASDIETVAHEESGRRRRVREPTRVGSNHAVSDVRVLERQLGE